MIVGVRKNGDSFKKAKKAGLQVADIAAAAAAADLVMLLMPDEIQGDIYRDHLRDSMKKARRLPSPTALIFTFTKLSRAPIWMF